MRGQGCRGRVRWGRIGGVRRLLCECLFGRCRSGKCRFGGRRVHGLYGSPRRRTRDGRVAVRCRRVTTASTPCLGVGVRWGYLSVCEEGGGFLFPHVPFFCLFRRT